MARLIEARVIQKAGTIEELNDSDLKYYDGEQVFVKSDVDDNVISYKVGANDKKFNELPYPDFYAKGKVTPSSVFTGLPSGVYIPTLNGLYNSSVTVNLADGYQVLHWDGSTLEKVVYPIDFTSVVYGGIIDDSADLSNPTEPIWYIASPGTYNTVPTITLTQNSILTWDGNQWSHTPFDLEVRGDMLVADTMAEIRNITPQIASLLTNGTYRGVTLLGYYEKGDTPATIDYFISSTTATDDGGGVIEVSGIKLEHEFNDGIDPRYYGAKGDGINDDSMSFSKAIQKAVGKTYIKVTPTGAAYLLGDITLPPNTTIRGTGANPCALGEPFIAGSPRINLNTSLIKIKDGSNGFIGNNTSTNRGGLIENIGIEGNDTDGAYGIKYLSDSWGISKVAIVGFRKGYAVILANCWRENFYDLKIRRCGVGILMDGNFGSVNGCSFIGLMIERTRIGVYQRRRIGGASFTANTFVSPVVEDLRISTASEQYDIPTDLVIPQTTLDRLNTTKEKFCAGFATEDNTHFLINSIYTESIDGVHLFAGLGCTYTVVAGHMTQGHTTSTVELNYRGSVMSTENGEFRVIGVKIAYNSDPALYTEPLITVQPSRDNLFMPVEFEWVGGVDNGRKIYKSSSSTVNFDTSPTRFDYSGIYQVKGRKFRNFTASEMIKTPFFSGDYGNFVLDTNVNNTIDFKSLTSGVNRYNWTLSNGINNTLTITYSDTTGFVPGTKYEIHINASITAGSSYSVVAGSNVVLSTEDISNISLSGRCRLEFMVLTDGRPVLTGVYRMRAVPNATTSVKGVVNQGIAVPDGSSIDTLLASLRTAGIIAT